jgi:thymidylate synthase
LNPAFAIAEVVWIMTGRNDAAILNYFNSALPKYAGCDINYHGAYGHRLRKHLGLDQLTRAYAALKANTTSRQVVLQIWDAKSDLPAPDGTEMSSDIPCNIVSMLKIRREKLEWTQIMRSNDLHLGLPYNMIQFTTLQEIIAGWLCVDVGSYNHLSDSLHVYSDCYQHLSRSEVVPVSSNTDSLALAKEESEEVFHALGGQLDMIIAPQTTADEVLSIGQCRDIPQAYVNMRCLLLAEAVRRRMRSDLIPAIMERCTNSLFRELYERWLGRVGLFPRQDNVDPSMASPISVDRASVSDRA